MTQAFLSLVEPAGIAAAMKLEEDAGLRQDEKRAALELELEKARYEVDRAFRQYDATEPENRLVAAELEARWNKALENGSRIEKALDAVPKPRPSLSEREKALLGSLAEDLPRLWNHPRTDFRTKKLLLRSVIAEIIVRWEEGAPTMELVIHWKGGQHGKVEIARSRRGKTRYATDESTAELVGKLARVAPDKRIAQILNRLGKKTGHGLPWNQARVNAFRHHNGIAPHLASESAGLITVEETAERLGVSFMSAQRMARRGILQASQVVVGAPWQVREEALSTPAVRREVARVKARGRRVPFEHADQKVFSFA